MRMTLYRTKISWWGSCAVGESLGPPASSLLVGAAEHHIPVFVGAE